MKKAFVFLVSLSLISCSNRQPKDKSAPEDSAETTCITTENITIPSTTQFIDKEEGCDISEVKSDTHWAIKRSDKFICLDEKSGLEFPSSAYIQGFKFPTFMSEFAYEDDITVYDLDLTKGDELVTFSITDSTTFKPVISTEYCYPWKISLYDNHIELTHNILDPTQDDRLYVEEINESPAYEYEGLHKMYYYGQYYKENDPTTYCNELGDKNDYILLGSKDQPITFSWYDNTKYMEKKIKCDYSMYVTDPFGTVAVKADRTKNGYFTFDVSKMASGLYVMQESDTSPRVLINLITQNPTYETSSEVECSYLNTVGTASNITRKNQYETKTFKYDDIYKGDLILVNLDNEYKFTEKAENLTTISEKNNQYYSVADRVLKLDINTIDALNEMMEDYYTATKNKDLYVIGAYMSIEDQNDKYYNGNTEFKAGYSDYHTGRSLDLAIIPESGESSGYYASEGIYEWIEKNAAKYGFILRFPEYKEGFTGTRGRTYTFRYVGVAHATYMYENNLCLEEYIDEIKKHTYPDKILKVPTDDSIYEVFYYPAYPQKDIELPVPKHNSYSVSGNNIDGFIVTVKNAVIS